MDWWEIAKAAGIPAMLLALIITQWVQTRAVKKEFKHCCGTG